ncbi:hypothetical protein [Photobacterium angustum]|uniref:hypothetical protein n=1 Tax=Photobacterium angustum TaxID=661 RepID=UPI0005DF784D|nr:hypothetical protein [Photobacterium angustum]KJG00116.1 hypothetical protein UB35_19905 [Photobacterium angustum]PSV61677.1 hypothetical protein CTM95_20460 [Photobacterium angustum]
MGKGGGGTKIADNEMQKELAKTSKAKWHHYNEISKPAEVQWVDDIKTMNDNVRYEKAQAEANTAVTMAADQATQDRLKQGGNVGRLNAAINQGATDRQKIQQDTSNRMEVNQQKQYLGGLAAANAVGAGKNATAIQVGSNAADTANNYARQQTQNRWNKQDGTQKVIGMGLGAAGNEAINRWGPKED